MSSAALNESAIESEARRLLAAEREAKRRAAFEKQRRLDREMAELAARERDARIALEAERIEAQRKAEEAMIAAKAKAEKEAYDAAVTAKMEEMRARPEVEVLRAELEELRAELRGEFDAVRGATPWSVPIQEIRSQIGACPWNSGISGLQSQIAALTASVNEFKGLYKKPARQVSVWFSSGMGSTGFNANNTGQWAWAGRIPSLTITYYVVPQNVYAAQGGTTTITLTDNTSHVIHVPECHKVFVLKAEMACPGSPAGNRDLTHLYKSMLESQ